MERGQSSNCLMKKKMLELLTSKAKNSKLAMTSIILVKILED